MTEKPEPTEQQINVLTSSESFKKRYNTVLVELDALYKGVFDDTEADSAAALCLLAQAALVKELGSAETRSRGLKRDIEFAKSDAYVELRANPPNGKKLAVTEAPLLINKDPNVQRLSREQNLAEKEARELAQLQGILREAHITFRMVKRGSNG